MEPVDKSGFVFCPLKQLDLLKEKECTVGKECLSKRGLKRNLSCLLGQNNLSWKGNSLTGDNRRNVDNPNEGIETIGT